MTPDGRPAPTHALPPTPPPGCEAEERAMEAVGRLAGGVAHELNNLLTAILGYADLVLDGLPAEDPTRRRLQEIHRAGERAAALTRQLLALGGKQVLRARVLDLRSVVEAEAATLRRILGDDVRMEVRTGAAPVSVEADLQQLGQILVHLALNARDAMPRGGRFAIDVDVAPGHARLRVTDDGRGMDAQTLSRAFEPFFTTKPPGSGAGLGLSTVYGIVRQSGGRVRAESEAGSGTTIEILLPLAVARPDEEEPEPESERRPGHETVLLVEDEDAVRRLARDVLEAAGLSVLLAGSGEAALEVEERTGEPIHLVVTDVVMPGMDGTQMAAELVRRRPGVQVLFMSGHSEEAVARRGAPLPGAAFLQKPFSPATLEQAVRAALGRAGPRVSRTG